MAQGDTETARRIAELEAERRALLQLSIGYDQLLDSLTRSRRFRLAEALGKLTGRVPLPRNWFERAAQTMRAGRLLPEVSKDSRTAIEHGALQQRLHALLYADIDAIAERQIVELAALPTVSVVSVLYRSENTIADFLAAFLAQDYAGPIEIVLVDDCSGDASAAIAQATADTLAANGTRKISIVSNANNLGNCLSRNAGVAASSGDIIAIIDADCIVNPGFVSAHVAEHNKGADIAIGPMGIESHGKPIPPLLDTLLADRALLRREMHLQDPTQLTSAVNCVTRNFSLSRRVLDRLGRELFDPRFSYRNTADTGYGWEDVEMGAALRRWGTRIGFTWDALSVHTSHRSTVDDGIRARGSARNFALLIDTHPQLLAESRDWAMTTADRIAAWVESTGSDPAPLLGPVHRVLREPQATAVPPIVYSAIAGDYDVPAATAAPGVVLFSDKPIDGRQTRPFDDVRGDPVRTAKKPKVLPHIYLAGEWSIWVDGNIRLLADPRDLVAEVEASGRLIGAFRHPLRTSLYDEALRCISAAKDDAELIMAQIGRYRSQGYPPDGGLAECNVLVRKHSHSDVAAAMRCWWNEIEAGSRRDQISFNYALWRSGIGYHELGGGALDVRTDPRFLYVPHAVLPTSDALS